MQKLSRKLVPWKLTWNRTLVESGLLLLLYIIWLIFRSPDSPSRAFIGNLAILVPVAAALLSIYLLYSRLRSELKKSWTFLGMALLCWLIGGFIRTYSQVLSGIHPPAFSAADIFTLFSYPFLFLAVIFYPSHNRYLPSRFRFMLDAVISSGVVAALGWLIIARPAFQSISGDFMTLLPLVYPVADLILLMIVVNTLLANPMSRRTAALWGASMFAFLVSDYVYSYQALIQVYQAGGVESLGWTVGGLVFGLSIVIESTVDNEKTTNEIAPDTGTRLQTILPVVLVIVLIWFVLADWRLREQPYSFGIWLALAMGLALIVRLGVRAGEVELDRYWQLFSGLADPTFMCDVKGKILVANPAFSQALKGSDGNTWEPEREGLLSLLDRKDINDDFLEHAASKAMSVEAKFINSQTPYLLSLSPIFTGDRRIFIGGVAYDLSDQKHQQRELQRAYRELQIVSRRLEDLNTKLEEKVVERTQVLSQALKQLEEQNKMLQDLDTLKSDFISMVSHELRTPLTSIHGGLELLLTRPGYRLEDKETMQLMKKEVQRLTHFVENILNLSVLEAGRLDVHVEPVDLNLVVIDVLRSMKTLQGVSRIRIKNISKLPAVLADESFLHSVFSQLLDNALKYTSSGMIVIEAMQHRGQLRVSVTDGGPGIPKEKQNLLFRRFQRLEAADSQSIYGYGLGLYLCKQLLQIIKSDLHYESPASGGARFYFDLKVSK